MYKCTIDSIALVGSFNRNDRQYLFATWRPIVQRKATKESSIVPGSLRALMNVLRLWACRPIGLRGRVQSAVSSSSIGAYSGHAARNACLIVLHRPINRRVALSFQSAALNRWAYLESDEGEAVTDAEWGGKHTCIAAFLPPWPSTLTLIPNFQRYPESVNVNHRQGWSICAHTQTHAHCRLLYVDHQSGQWV